jgi:Tol biopolymer transport system component
MARTILAAVVVAVLGTPAAVSSPQPAAVSFLASRPEATIDPPSIVCTVPAEGSTAAVRAVRPAGRYVSFAWSPDGSRIAIVSRDGKRLVLETMRPDGSRRVRLAEATEQWGPLAVEPAWAPDGKLLAFVAGGSLFVARPDGSQRRLLVRAQSPISGRAANPGWSPDGTRIVFVWWWVGPVGAVRASIRPDGTDERAESKGTLPIWGAWSPDRTRVAFVDGSTGRVIVAGWDGVMKHAVSAESREWAETPAWSPDGTKIAFARRPPYRGWPAPPADVYAVGAAGSNEHAVAATDLDERAPAWRAGTHPNFGACVTPEPRHPQTTTVPKVVGLNVIDGFAGLRRAGLRVALPERFTLDSRSLALIGSQTPAPGEHVEWGTVVMLRTGGAESGVVVIDVDMPSYVVPDFTGKALAEGVRWTYDKLAVWWRAPDLPPLPATDAESLLAAYRIVGQGPAPGATLTPVRYVDGRNVFTPLTLSAALR